MQLKAPEKTNKLVIFYVQTLAYGQTLFNKKNIVIGKIQSISIHLCSKSKQNQGNHLDCPWHEHSLYILHCIYPHSCLCAPDLWQPKPACIPEKRPSSASQLYTKYVYSDTSSSVRLYVEAAVLWAKC